MKAKRTRRIRESAIVAAHIISAIGAMVLIETYPSPIMAVLVGSFIGWTIPQAILGPEIRFQREIRTQPKGE